MPVPRIYRQSGDPTLVNYNFTELASGLGYVNLYLADVHPSNTYMLTTNSFYSVSGALVVESAATLNADFSTTVNLPFITKGKAIINIPTLAYCDSAGPKSPDRTFTLSIKKNSTVLVSGAVTLDYGSLATGAKLFKNIALPLEIPTTKFNNGDVLTLNMDVSTDGTSTCYTYIGDDPANRDGNTLSGHSELQYTAARMFLPIKADL